MKKILLLILIQLIILNKGNAQTFELDTLQYKGDTQKYINFVIMGDGYTVAEQDSFYSHAKDLSEYLFSQSPWSNYKNYFNVFCIKVISAESGIQHPHTAGDCGTATVEVPESNPDSYFGSSFDSYGIHRLVCATNTAAIEDVLKTNFPNYDQAFIIANTPYYGGSGGEYPVSTTDESSPEITDHEIGHAFAGLADEYYAGDVYAKEKPNMTQETNPSFVKWKNWMGYNGVGIYQHQGAGNSAEWYKPNKNCKMEYLGTGYCCVCQETIIEKIHSLANPIVSYLPTESKINSLNQFIDFKLTELMKPIPNSLNIIWKLDGKAISNNIESIQIDQNLLTKGMHILEVTVVDTTNMLRVDDHATLHINTISWTINKTRN